MGGHQHYSHSTDKQTEAKQLSAGFHVPNLGPFLFSCYLKLRSSTSCWFFSPFLRQAHDWVFLPQDKHGKGASDGEITQVDPMES